MIDVSRSELLGLLRQGGQIFNDWRVKHEDAVIDLSGADLSGLDLEEVFLSGANLVGTDFSHTSLRNAVLSGAYLKNAQFVAADLTGALFGPPDLIDSTLALSPLGRRTNWGAELEGAVFTGATLEGTSFREAPLDGVDLRGCDLSTLDLRGTNLADAVVDAMPEPRERTSGVFSMVTPNDDQFGNTWITVRWT
ncbi:pentapeptide repeat-containing protein [Actinocrispum sp. NPDC049592]|uniref:pentapeptide repeat-containing protein n=1 Tax=Actinocrispum sp. NPDC049592 TaxID=3154835 RepID=UPI003437D226